MIPIHSLIYKILGYVLLFVFQILVLLEFVFLLCLYCSGIYSLVTYPIIFNQPNYMLLIVSTLFIGVVGIIIGLLLAFLKNHILRLSRFSKLRVLVILFCVVLSYLYMFSGLMTNFFVTRGGCGNYRMVVSEELFTITSFIIVLVSFLTFYLKTHIRKG